MHPVRLFTEESFKILYNKTNQIILFFNEKLFFVQNSNNLHSLLFYIRVPNLQLKRKLRFGSKPTSQKLTLR